MMIVHSGEPRTQEEQLRDELEVLGAMLYNAELHPMKDGGTKIAAIQAQIRETEQRCEICNRGCWFPQLEFVTGTISKT